MTTTIRLGHRDLLVVSGLPGAGKSTMLRRVEVDPIPVLDSDQIRHRLRALLPDGIPYRLYRPLVHALHRIGIVRHALVAPGPVVVHEPSTRASTRLLLAVVGALSRRPVRMLWLDVTAEQALAGQRHRGRLVRTRSFVRHVKRTRKLRESLLADQVPAGWRSAALISRAQADKLRFSRTDQERSNPAGALGEKIQLPSGVTPLTSSEVWRHRVRHPF